jgi:hypothetical protein
MLDHDCGGVGHVDPHLYYSRRDQNIDFSTRKTPHDHLFIVSRQTPVQQS